MREIILSNKGLIALVDDEDLQRVSLFKWYALQPKRRPHCFYAATNIDRSIIYLHRFVLDAPKGFDVDHKNGLGLDCQKDNLRFATRSQNNVNKAKEIRNKLNAPGVYVVKSRRGGKLYCARIQKDHKTISRWFFTLEEAAQERTNLLRKHFGDFVPDRLRAP